MQVKDRIAAMKMAAKEKSMPAGKPVADVVSPVAVQSGAQTPVLPPIAPSAPPKRRSWSGLQAGAGVEAPAAPRDDGPNEGPEGFEAPTPEASVPQTLFAEQTGGPAYPLKPSRAQRLHKLSADASANKPPPVPASLATEVKAPAQAWLHANLPAGSGYTEEEWVAAEAAHPGMVVFEVLKTTERGLVAIPAQTGGGLIQQMLARSLVIHEKAAPDCPWADHASARVEHTGDLGVQKYIVVRSMAAREEDPWLDGSTLKMPVKDAPAPTPRSAPARSRAERFREASRAA
jgi:hypothetical protein